MTTLDNYRSSYDRIAKDDIISEFEKYKYRRIIPFSKFIKTSSSDKVLEVGVGRGLLLNRLNGTKIGIDIAKDYIDLFRGNYIGMCCPIESMPFMDNEFDVVVADSVLEHVLDLVSCLKEICRVLKPQGRFYMLVPLNEDLSKYDWEVDKYGIKEHQRTFHEPVQLPFFKVVRTGGLLPKLPERMFVSNKSVAMSRINRLLYRILYLYPTRISSGYEMVFSLTYNYLLLHIYHYEPRVIMIEARKI